MMTTMIKAKASVPAPVQALGATAVQMAPVRRAAAVRAVPAKPLASAAAMHSTQHAAPGRTAAQTAAKLARRDRVVLEHLPLVKAIAVRVHENLPVHVDLDDLVHAGILGLFDAASKFNPDKQVVFSSYAKHRI